MKVSNLSRRAFLIAGGASAAAAWLNSRAGLPVSAPAAPAVAAVARAHRTLVGVL